MYSNKVSYKLNLGRPIFASLVLEGADSIEQTNAAREYYESQKHEEQDKKELDSRINHNSNKKKWWEPGEPLLHVGQHPLYPKGNCKSKKFGCTVCTPYNECIQPEGIWSKEQKNRKKQSRKEVISDDERHVLDQIRKQQRWQSFLDIGPIGGAI